MINKGEMMAAIKDIARLSDCSTSTVSRVLNNRDGVDPETKKRVLQVIEEMDYKPSLLAKGLRVKQGKLIALVVPETISHSFSSIMHYVMKYAYESDYHVISGDTQDNADTEETFIDDLLRRNINGIIFSRVSDESRIMPKLIKRKIPFIVIDRTLEQENVPIIVLDNYQAGYLAGKHLVDLGHHNIACVTGPLNIILCRERLHGFTAALEEKGLSLPDSSIFEGNFKFSSGISAVESLFNKGKEISAVWALNDMMNFGVLKGLTQKGIKVPEEVSLIGMDNMDFCEMVTPSLTTIRYPFDQMAENAIDLIVRQNNGEEVSGKVITLSPSLVIRESSIKYKEG